MSTPDERMKVDLEFCLDAAERVTYRADKVVIRDDPGSTQFQVDEANRYIVAIDSI